MQCIKSIVPVTILLPTDINIFCDVTKDYKANNEPAFWTSIILLKVNPEPIDSN